MPNNSHFDTTRANVEFVGTAAVDLPVAAGTDPDRIADFKGNLDTAALEEFIARVGQENIPLCMITVTNNSGGGQPVLHGKHPPHQGHLPAARHPLVPGCLPLRRNAYFIKLREPGYAGRPAKISPRECSPTPMVHDERQERRHRQHRRISRLERRRPAPQGPQALILTEGFPTYGGLAGRDLEAMAIGLDEVLDEHYLHYRLRSIEYLGERLWPRAADRPAARRPRHLRQRQEVPAARAVEQYPGQALVFELFRTAGIRAVEIGCVMFGKETRRAG